MQKTLIQAYLNSSYTYNQTRLHLDPLPDDLPIVFPERWAMVTAYNPESRQLTPEENQKRHEDLETQVRQMGFPVDHYFAGEGEWEEPGCLIRGISLAAAIQLGKDFEQNAVLFGVGSRVGLVWLEPLLVVRMWWEADQPVANPGEHAKRLKNGRKALSKATGTRKYLGFEYEQVFAVYQELRHRPEGAEALRLLIQLADHDDQLDHRTGFPYRPGIQPARYRLEYLRKHQDPFAKQYRLDLTDWLTTILEILKNSCLSKKPVPEVLSNQDMKTIFQAKMLFFPLYRDFPELCDLLDASHQTLFFDLRHHLQKLLQHNIVALARKHPDAHKQP